MRGCLQPSRRAKDGHGDASDDGHVKGHKEGGSRGNFLFLGSYTVDLAAHVGALASVDARRDAEISDIGLFHETAAKKMLSSVVLKKNSQLDALKSGCAAVL
jgi:hypothetical protein